jgi:hypothetical protein
MIKRESNSKENVIKATSSRGLTSIDGHCTWSADQTIAFSTSFAGYNDSISRQGLGQTTQDDVNVPWDGGKSGSWKGVHGSSSLLLNVFVVDYGDLMNVGRQRSTSKRQQADGSFCVILRSADALMP